MSEMFVDGGHDHGSHVHAGHGGDGSAVGGPFGSHGHHNQGIFSQLFADQHDHGGEHGSHSGHHHHHSGDISSKPQGSASWTSALRGIKMSDALQGINVTPNMLLLILFLGFAAWLGVVYWVRHHEPFASQVLGTRGVHAPTGHADRHIVNGIRNALPIRTAPTSGMIYVPGVPAASPDPAVPAAAMASPSHSDSAMMPVVSQLPAAPQVVPMMSPAARTTGTPGAYHVPIQTVDGVRLKTVVNR